MEVYELAYAAATVDCDGTIGIRAQKPRGTRNYPYYYIMVGVANTNSVLINWLHKSFGGSVYIKEYRNDSWKNLYMWSLSTQQAREFLVDILPYLKLKWEQAETAIELCDRISRGVSKLSDLELSERSALKEAVMILNKRGV